jgi:hypothetical protein
VYVLVYHIDPLTGHNTSIGTPTILQKSSLKRQEDKTLELGAVSEIESFQCYGFGAKVSNRSVS